VARGPVVPALAVAALGVAALAGLAAGACCPVGPGRHGYAEAEYAARLAEVRGKAPPGFTTVVAPPFVVAGDGPPEGVREDAEKVITWAATRLKADFFELDPGSLMEVWLFGSEESYLSNTSAIFHHVPTTPYGYYSPCDRALVMNVATGYGTLVHEIVHPFMAANFPAAPPWFDEGLASLFEAPMDVGGHLHGGTNWRLDGLQQAILQRRTRTFEELTSLGRRAFYGDDQGLNYAEARYLLYYLQERDLLVPYYRAFVASAAADPTGYRTLQRVLGEPDMAAFRRRWEEFVLGLVYVRRG
jgi:hypothetical protein